MKRGGSSSKKPNRSNSREKRPHSSTFVSNPKHDVDSYLLSSNAKKNKSVTKHKEGSKPKKQNKRVRSASPAGLKNFLTQKQAQAKAKPQRMIGGHLYHPSMHTFAAKPKYKSDN